MQMAEPLTDRQLLWEYVSQKSHQAFEIIVGRHADLVFGTAMRRLGNPPAAEEVAQNVFIALARKAGRIQVDVSLAAWLHKTAVLEARHWWRTELRRERREQAAVNLGTTMQDNASLLKSLGPLLDDALLELRPTDRQALMLRYFEKRNYREVGAHLGMGEDAARKRVDKALTQLTRFFRRQGYAVPTAAATASVLVESIQSAPINLARNACKAALAAGGTASLTIIGLLVAKFFGLRVIQTTMLGLAICAVPVDLQWQHASSETAKGQEIKATLSDLEEAKSQLEDSIALLETRVQNAKTKAATPITSAAPESPTGLYFWDEDSDYVRLPKSMLPRMTFGNTEYNVPQGERPVVDKDGTPSPVLLDALGLTAEESQKVSELCRSLYSEYLSLVLPRCYVTNTGRDLSYRDSRVADFVRTNRESRTWVMPRLEEGERLRERLKLGLTELTDDERVALFFEQTQNQFNWYWNGLGTVSRRVTVYRKSPTTIGTFLEYGRPGGGIPSQPSWYVDVPEALQPFAQAWQKPPDKLGSPVQQ